MGTITYEGGTVIVVDDRVLAHLQLVITAKLRRNEGFTLTWVAPDDEGPRRRMIWLHPALALEYAFDSAEVPAINRAWVSDLAAAANGPTGLVVSPEPGERTARADQPVESTLYTPERGMAQVWGVKRRP